MSYLLVALFALADAQASLVGLGQAIIGADTETVLASLLTAITGGAGATAITGWLALRKQRQERAAAAQRFDLDRFDKSMELLIAENERLYDEVQELRAREGANHVLILDLQGKLSAAQAEARVALDSASIAHTRLAELEGKQP